MEIMRVTIKQKSNKNRKGQASTEYLILFSVISLLIGSSVYLIYSSFQNTDISISAKSVKNIALKMISKAEEIYYLPPPTKITYNEEFPINIISIKNETEKGWNVISFVIEGDIEIPVITKIPIKIDERDIKKGTHTIEMFTENKDNFAVNIDIK